MVDVIVNSGNFLHMMAAPEFNQNEASQAFELALEKSFEASPSYNLPSINAAEREEKIVSGKLFLSKDVTAAQASQQVEKAVNALLDKLQIQTLDLLVVATPHHNEINEFKTIWEAMESCVSRGLVKALGVVNFSTTQLAALLEIAAIRPVVNQIPLTQLTTAADRALLSYAKSNGIELRPHPVTDATLDVTGIKPPRRVTRTHKETESYQVQWALRYSITAKHQFLTTARGFVYSVHNSTTERITAN